MLLLRILGWCSSQIRDTSPERPPATAAKHLGQKKTTDMEDKHAEKRMSDTEDTRTPLPDLEEVQPPDPAGNTVARHQYHRFLHLTTIIYR